MILAILFLYIIHNKHLRRRFFVVCLLFLSISFLVNMQSNGRLYGRFLSIGQDAHTLATREEGYEKAGANRVYIWSRTLGLVKERPWIGYGLETLDSVFVDKYEDEMIRIYNVVYSVDRAHNEFLHIAVSTGVPSLFAYIAFLFSCLKKGIKLNSAKSAYLPYLTAVAAYITQAFFNISVVSVAYIFWIFLGVISNGSIFDESKQNQ